VEQRFRPSFFSAYFAGLKVAQRAQLQATALLRRLPQLGNVEALVYRFVVHQVLPVRKMSKKDLKEQGLVSISTMSPDRFAILPPFFDVSGADSGGHWRRRTRLHLR
jgi:hypothetical protein